MFDRVALKENAKAVLRGTYWWCLLACVIGAVLGSTGNFSTTIRYTVEQVGIPVALGLSGVGILLSIFLSAPVSVGLSYYFLRLYNGNHDISDLFVSFNSSNYLKVVTTMLVRDIYIILWSLLLIIPGIVKALAYSMVPYILAENPEIGTSRAIELSNQMTMGSKG